MIMMMMMMMMMMMLMMMIQRKQSNDKEIRYNTAWLYAYFMTYIAGDAVWVL